MSRWDTRQLQFAVRSPSVSWALQPQVYTEPAAKTGVQRRLLSAARPAATSTRPAGYGATTGRVGLRLITPGVHSGSRDSASSWSTTLRAYARNLYWSK